MKSRITIILIVAMLAVVAVGAYAQDDLAGDDDPVEGPPNGPIWDIVDNEVTDSDEKDRTLTSSSVYDPSDPFWDFVANASENPGRPAQVEVIIENGPQVHDAGE